MHFQTVRCKRNLYCMFHGKKKCLIVWKIWISFLLCPGIFLSVLVLKTLSLCFLCHLRDQVSNPYRTAGKSIVLYLLIFLFLDSKHKGKAYIPSINQFFFSSCMLFLFVSAIPKYIKFATFSNNLLAIFMLTRQQHSILSVHFETNLLASK